MAIAWVARAGAADDFLAGTKDGGPIFSLADSVFVGRLTFARLLAVGSVTLPRFHTFCTNDLADDRNPNREGLGLGFSKYAGRNLIRGITRGQISRTYGEHWVSAFQYSCGGPPH